MNLDAFLRRRSTTWQQLEALLAQAQNQPERLSMAEIETLGRLYRLASADLALAQRDFPRQQVTHYLNQLVSRGHALIYRPDPVSRRAFARFFTVVFPQLYRELLPYTSVAFLLFWLAALAAFFVVWRSPDTIYVIAGQGIAPLVRQVEAGALWTDIAPAARSAASALILTNNIQVTFMALAGGITGGVLTVLIMLLNGLQIGAIFGLLQAHDLSHGLAEFVVAHGFIELSVIFVAGGCGLYMGDGLLRPGLERRSAALIRRSRRAVQVVLGCAPLLIIAGLIEGFISPSGLPWAVKLAVGLGTGVLLHFYWLRGGRTDVNRAAPSSAIYPSS